MSRCLRQILSKQSATSCLQGYIYLHYRTHWFSLALSRHLYSVLSLIMNFWFQEVLCSNEFINLSLINRFYSMLYRCFRLHSYVRLDQATIIPCLGWMVPLLRRWWRRITFAVWEWIIALQLSNCKAFCVYLPVSVFRTSQVWFAPTTMQGSKKSNSMLPVSSLESRSSMQQRLHIQDGILKLILSLLALTLLRFH